MDQSTDVTLLNIKVHIYCKKYKLTSSRFTTTYVDDSLEDEMEIAYLTLNEEIVHDDKNGNYRT